MSSSTCVNNLRPIFTGSAPNFPTDNGSTMYVPKGFAHGYQTLSDAANVFYMVSDLLRAGGEGGLAV